jgi:tetratricopeptide (TPR) repeat protein
VTVLGPAIVVLAVLAGPGPAPPPPALAHDAALHALADRTDVDARRRGASALGEVGTMSDSPRLVEALRDADPGVRAAAERALLDIWHRSGDAEIDRLFALGMEQMRTGDVPAAAETFSRVIARKPDFAEAWNKRATIRYYTGEYEKSLADCDEVMKRNPWHFGALSGYGMIYLQLGEPDKAVTWFERALAVNPNLHSVDETLQALKQLLRQRRRQAI